MSRSLKLASLLAVALAVAVVRAQEPDARQIAQERAQAERDVPHLVEALELMPGMTVADVGSGGGAVTVVLGKWMTGGRVYATDISERGLRLTREYVKKEGLTNVTVIEGAAGVPANREGHGVPPPVVEAELTAAGFAHVKTVDKWPPDDRNPLFLVLFKKP